MILVLFWLARDLILKNVLFFFFQFNNKVCKMISTVCNLVESGYFVILKIKINVLPLCVDDLRCSFRNIGFILLEDSVLNLAVTFIVF